MSGSLHRLMRRKPRQGHRRRIAQHRLALHEAGLRTHRPVARVAQVPQTAACSTSADGNERRGDLVASTWAIPPECVYIATADSLAGTPLVCKEKTPPMR